MTAEVDCVLRDPDLHDGTLTGIVVQNGHTLELHCFTVDHQRYTLRLPSLVRLRVDNFLQGNIIFELSVHASGFAPELVKKVFGEDGPGEPPWLADELNRLSNGTWTLLELTSSYGCDLLALSEGELIVEPA